MHGYTSPLTALRHALDPERHYVACQRRFGDLFLTRTGLGPVVVVGSPDGARQLFTADPDTFESGANGRLLSPLLGPAGLLSLSGEEHRRQRRLLMPPFHGERLARWGAAIVETTARVAAELHMGRTLRAVDVAQRITLEVICRVLFGAAGERAEALAGAVRAFVSAITPALAFTPALQRLPVGPGRRFARARAALGAQLSELASAPDVDHGSVLALLRAARHEDGSALSPAELRDQLVTLLFTGHETTATTIAWVVYWLCRSPGTLDQLRHDLALAGDTPEAIAAVPLLEAVCLETLRICPVVADVPRTLVRPLEVLGERLPAGTTVSVSPLLVHRDAVTFPEPDTWLPGRFVERTYSPFEYLPFGGGHRRCIGAAFALYEMKLMIATLLRSLRFELASTRPEQLTRRGFVLGPHRGVEIRAVP